MLVITRSLEWEYFGDRHGECGFGMKRQHSGNNQISNSERIKLKKVTDDIRRKSAID